MLRVLLLSTAVIALVGCKSQNQPLDELPGPHNGQAGVASPRVNGVVTPPQGPLQPPTVAYGGSASPKGKRGAVAGEEGDVMLNFADTDIKEVIRQILGDILHVNYVVDPAVAGTVTLETHQPVQKAQLLATLETLLSQNGATLTQSGGIYRVIPSAVALTEPSMAGDTTFGSDVEVLHYTSAKDLVKVLQPFVGDNARLIADPNRNALLVTGEPNARAAIVSMIHAFDIDVLANQSYALFPVTADDPGKVATDMQKAMQTEGEGALAGVVKIIPMERVNAILVVSSQRRFVEDARRLFQLVDKARRSTARTWHVYYVQNGDAGDLANMLQRAFNPKEAQAEKAAGGSTAPGHNQAKISDNNQSGFNNNNQSGSGGGIGGGTGGLGSTPGGGTTGSSPSSSGSGTPGGGSDTQGSGGSGNEDLPMPVEETESLSAPTEENTNTIRIIPNYKNNAILYYATADEAVTIEGMMHKIDIVPLQVRIDATIAEVTLNDNLKYGTQFYFKNLGTGIDGLLTQASSVANAMKAKGDLPGFQFGYSSSTVAATLSALQSVTDVRVLSSPQLLVLDNQMARLQVGDNVPYLTQSAQSTITDTADIINSVAYQETGVILQVVPRVNSGGLVTLDISQEVSDVVPAGGSSNIDSPTFSERKVRSHVVVQDGQTIGLAGLISDNTSRSNAGIPYLKDIPVLGTLFGTQSNTRQRTELLILITPHVLQDQRDARSLTQDMREKLRNAGLVPQQLQNLVPSGSSNPNARLTPP
ncbi:MAG TPA: type II secretion system secretin GspD [Alphaproteobacteria bacterium]|nr:type II secretion system secretin GspD [Alphaproteobacteria bacterium]